MERRMTEKEIERSILDFLTIRNFTVFKHDPGGFYSGRRLSSHRRTGVSDIIGFLKNGTFLAIEVKTDQGRCTDKQLEFIEAVNSNGGVAFVATCIMDVRNEFAARGICI